MKTTIVLAAALAGALLLPASALSQESPRRPSEGPTHSFAFGAGITDYRVRDNYLSPVAFGGSLLALGASYRRETAHSRQAIETSFASGTIKSAAQPRDVTPYDGSISYAYLRSLRPPGGGFPLALLAGVGVSSFLTWTDFNATDPATGYTFFDRSWYWSHALDAHLLADYGLAGGRHLALRVSAPVVRLVSRPENGHAFNASNASVMRNLLHAATGGSVVALWESPVVEWQLEFQQPIGARVGLRIGYAFQNASSETPLPLRMYTNRVTVSLVLLGGAPRP